MAFRIEPFSSALDRSRFSSGSEPLDRYIREQASQDIRRQVATCFVATDADAGEVAGYYTLAAGSVALTALSPEIAKKLPRYPAVPAALLGRLAVARSFQGKGLGEILLADAVLRVSRAELGVFAIIVDAKDSAARRFYEKHGFELLLDEPRRLCLPIPAALPRFGGLAGSGDPS